MKKLIPFTLERWQQGNCTVKTADGSEVKKFIDFETHGLRYGGVVDGKIRNWLNDGSASSLGISPNDLMLEVDCEVVYVSLFRDTDGVRYARTSNTSGLWQGHNQLIKEIKVDL